MSDSVFQEVMDASGSWISPGFVASNLTDCPDPLGRQ